MPVDFFRRQVSHLKKLTSRLQPGLLFTGVVIFSAVNIHPQAEKGSLPEDQTAPMVRQSEKSFIENARFSTAGGYHINFGDLSTPLPSGYSGFLAYEHDEADPYDYTMRFETGYFYFSKDSDSITGYKLALGPLWIMPFKDLKGNIIAGALLGASYLTLENEEGAASSTKFTAHVFGGYEYPFKIKSEKKTDELFVFIQLRGTYIYDSTYPLISAGVYTGAGYRFGEVERARY